VFDHVGVFQVGYNEIDGKNGLPDIEIKLYRYRPIALGIKTISGLLREVFPARDFHQTCGLRRAMQRSAKTKSKRQNMAPAV
jgi:hypothetical protein